MSPTFACIYCNKVKPISERSLEHIWPQVYGGNSCPSWFLSEQACKPCNSVLGRYVDAEFARTQFGTGMRLEAAMPFIDTAKPSPLPLIYMGVQATKPSDREVCETWIGPRGEAVYYFHENDGDDFSTYAGGDPVKRRKNPGRVYLGFSRPNFFWIMTALVSVKAKFPKSELRLLTHVDEPRLTAMCAGETEQSAKDLAYVLPLWCERTQSVHQSLNVDYGLRFQSKLGLGFGHALFGEAFRERPYARTLCAGLWHRHGRGDPPPLIGKGFWGDDDPAFNARFSSEGAFTLLFSRMHEGAWLSVFMPTGKSTHTLILPGNELLRSPHFSQFSNNFVVLIFPAIERHIGPIPAFAYVMHRNGHRIIPELQQIEARRRTLAQIEAEVAKFNMSADMAA